MTDNGPYQTGHDASGTAAVRAVYAAFDADPGAGKMRPHNTAMLTGACEAARVELGAYDAQTLAWLGNWEPETCAVIAGVIVRAWEAGKASALEGAVTEWGIRYTHKPDLLPPEVRIDRAESREGAERMMTNPGYRSLSGDETLMRREVGPWKEVPDAV